MFMNACSNIILKHILQQFKSTLVITKNVIYLSIYAPKEKKAAHSVAVSFIALCGACACDELSASWLRAGKHAPAATAREAGFSISETEKQLQLFWGCRHLEFTTLLSLRRQSIGARKTMESLLSS